jgi:hypothetical protein
VTPVATYAYGGGAQWLPEHIGIPFAGHESYYMLEIHYEDPNHSIKRSFSDNSGFRIHYANKSRANDAGIFINGISISDTQIIPPKQKLFNNVGICGPSCKIYFKKFFLAKFCNNDENIFRHQKFISQRRHQYR